MKLITEVTVERPGFALNYKENGLVVGSCFATHIGERMSLGKMNAEVNPTGIMYNPLSVLKCFEILYSGDYYSKENLYRHNGLWHSFAHHGSFSGVDPDEVTGLINSRLDSMRSKLASLGYIIVTLGTAWVYERGGDVVANCHKLPESEFVRRRMDIAEVVAAMETVIRKNPHAKIIFTVSPMRHIKDGLSANSASKAILRVACDELSRKYSNAWYFPAYEIMTDELRDYRFYADDMLHPSDRAAEYIWERFSGLAIDAPSRDLIEKSLRIHAAMQHRPLHPEGSEYAKFRESMRRQVEKLASEYKDVDFYKELQFFA